jgi:type VI secretion system secreted protein VgrG
MPVSVLPNGDVKVGNNIIIKGDLEFQTKTLAGLGQIASTPTGEALLQSIDKNGKTVTIQKTTGGNSCGYSNGAGRFQNADGTPGAGSDATVNYNPDRTSTGTEDWETRPPAIGLAHELVHAEQAGKGVQKPGTDNNDARPDASDPTKTEQENKRELEAAGIPPYDTYPYNENKIRKEWPPPQPERKWY